MKETFKLYYALTKPGIIYANLLAVAAGFFLATRGTINVSTLIGVLFGVAFIVASACVFNNYLDRNIDKKMARTKNRPLVMGHISIVHALWFASILCLLGFAILALTTNLLTVVIGVSAIIFYVVLYGIAKRWSVHGTIVGSIAGALPPIAGYTAVTNTLDSAGLLLGLIWVCWQMPHFFAIAMYRQKDYANAGIPVLPVKKGLKVTKYQIILYSVGFAVAAMLMVTTGYTHIIYTVVIGIVSLIWVYIGLKGLKKTIDEVKWARQMFFYSLIVMLVLCVMLSIGSVIA